MMSLAKYPHIIILLTPTTLRWSTLSASQIGWKISKKQNPLSVRGKRVVERSDDRVVSYVIDIFSYPYIQLNLYSSIGFFMRSATLIRRFGRFMI